MKKCSSNEEDRKKGKNAADFLFLNSRFHAFPIQNCLLILVG